MRKKTKFFLFFFYLIINCYSAKSQSDSLQRALSIAKEDTVKINILLSLSHENSSKDRFKAFEYAKQALSLSEKLSENKKTGESLNCLGDLYWFSGDYTKASTNYFKALNIYEKLNDQKGIAECYRNIGWIYQGQGNYELTLQYYFKSLKINETLKLQTPLLANYDDLGILYKLMGNYDKAIEYCNKTLAIGKEMKSTKGIATGYGNLASVYRLMGKHQLCIENYEKSNSILLENEDYYNLSSGYNGAAECYISLNNPDKSIENSLLAIKIAKKFNYQIIESSAYANLAEAYAMKKDYTNAYVYLKLFVVIQDSTYNEANSAQINEMSAKYESDKKELMINSLEKDKALSDEKLEQEQKFKIYLILFCLMIAGFAFMLFRGNIQKKKANNALTYAYKEIEIKNKDITDSINYSKRIQEATLPPKELKNQLFPDAFVLFKPKDIVSGDFYWFAEKNGHRLIAACDCTGHGVPGALMSMIGNNLLNQIVNEKGITSSDEILNQLHSEVRKTLKQNEQPESRDGMDIALVVFNNKNEIDFAGAQRPLWIIQKNELTEIKPNKFSIGGLQTETNRVFINHKIQLTKGDAIYLFSDGFVDQFGGEHGKKYMTKNFKKLLLNICEEPMLKQERMVEKELDDWRGKSEQVDDVLIIGIKI